ncbi:alanine racemase [Psychromonas sp. MME2]|uniref:alanine racemase n=1 Tax=unclassified Psychromonas TaxID=2614957 RepID=UPI00339C75FB
MDSTYAVIDLVALRSNLQVLQQKAPQSQILAVIKADAYGHGMVKIAQALTGVYAFGVARLNEAIRLRNAGIDKPILLLEGFFEDDDLEVIVEHNLETVIHSPEQVQALLKANLHKPIHAWLKLDTGMHRLGFTKDAFSLAYEQLKNSPNVQKPINLMTHFSCSDELDNAMTKLQIDLFNRQTNTLIEGNGGLRSLANSAAILAWPKAHAEVIRPGIALYGVSPFAEESAQTEQLKPVMTLKSRVIALKQLKAGDHVGYGANWTAAEDTTIAVIAIGYGDGYPRMAPAGTPVLINGRIVPIVGRVSMDMLTVDLGQACKDKVGDQVTLWGEGLPATEVAQHIGTIAYELITKLTSRVALHYRE